MDKLPPWEGGAFPPAWDCSVSPEVHVVSYCSYLQPNGYKPTPMDLTQIQLSDRMKELVELLAENTHNVWARERIKQGWTYGINEVGWLRPSNFFLAMICQKITKL